MTIENQLKRDKESGKEGNQMITRHEYGINKTADEETHWETALKNQRKTLEAAARLCNPGLALMTQTKIHRTIN